LLVFFPPAVISTVFLPLATKRARTHAYVRPRARTHTHTHLHFLVSSVSWLSAYKFSWYCKTPSKRLVNKCTTLFNITKFILPLD
jgi:hypothetical protein